MWTSRTGTELSTGSAQTLPLDRRTRSPRRTKKASLEGLTLVRFILDPAELALVAAGGRLEGGSVGGVQVDGEVLDAGHARTAPVA